MKPANIQADEIARSLELAGERGGDITPLVYGRVFAEDPEMLALFVRDKSGAVRGEMLARVIETIFDYLGDDYYASNLIGTEAVTHAGYGVPRDIFPKFFDALAATLKDVLGPDWSPGMDTNWNNLLNGLRRVANEAG